MTKKAVLAVALVVLASTGAGAVAGYAFGRDLIEPPAWTRWVRESLLGWTPPAPPTPPRPHATHRFGSIFTTLLATRGTVPVDREGAGGGITSFGDEILVLTHEGRIFAAGSPADIHETAIRTPDNGFAAYRRAAEGRFRHLTHSLPGFRYNDLLHYRSGAHHGLAISYTDYDEAESCYRTTVAVLELSPTVDDPDEIDAAPGDWEVLHRTRPCLPLKDVSNAIDGHMAGGSLAFRPPSTLFLANGDYAWDGMNAPEALAQDPDNDYGKVLALDLDSSAARVFSLGHRNTQGMTVDADGDLWVVEHGARGGDELNRVLDGHNYGWPEEALGVQYSGLPFPGTLSYGRHDVHTAPTLAWIPSMATSSVISVEGFHETWDGDLLVGTLRTESLLRVRIVDGRALFAEPIQIGVRVRDVHQLDAGTLVVWTDDHELVFIRPDHRTPVAGLVERHLSGVAGGPSRVNGIRTALDRCMECHTLEPGTSPVAPPLYSVFGAPVAATGYRDYTPALRALSGTWTRERLAAFIADPDSFAPGTSMPDTGIDDPAVIEGLIDLLEAIRNQSGAGGTDAGVNPARRPSPTSP